MRFPKEALIVCKRFVGDVIYEIVDHDGAEFMPLHLRGVDDNHNNYADDYDLIPLTTAAREFLAAVKEASNGIR